MMRSEIRNSKLIKIFMIGVIIIIISISSLNIQLVVTGDLYDISKITKDNSLNHSLKTFSSYEEFTAFLRNLIYRMNDYFNYYLPTIYFNSAGLKEVWEISKEDFSKTNIQVEGVDEPDVVKTDGRYLYVVANNKVYIIKAIPVEEAKIVSIIVVNCSIKNIFINGNKVIVFGDVYNFYSYEEDSNETVDKYQYNWFYSGCTFIKIFDTTNIEHPSLKKDISIAGSYFDARMIDNYVYVVTFQYVYDIISHYSTDEIIIPEVLINGRLKQIPLEDIHYIETPYTNSALVHIVSINVKSEEDEILDKIFILGGCQNIYVSKNNIYIAYETYYYDYPLLQQVIDEVIYPLLPEKLKQDIDCARGFDIPDYNKIQVINWILDGYLSTLDEQNITYLSNEIAKYLQRTIIHKISIEGGEINYQCNGSVTGRVLNQFSMDEYNGFFRIATQIDGIWYHNWLIAKYSRSEFSTNVYVLDENLKEVSSVENIAPGENMHSARFMESRVYLVTFKKIDPFFVIDLSDPFNPKILGELKIPGYSDYLHPFDENHIIGVGKDTDDEGDFAWYQGLKLAIFDVSDPQNPIEVSKIIIGDRGTESPVLSDHKAFLFDKEKGILVIPVSLYEISEEIKQQNNGDTDNMYGEFKFQGAYVYRLNLNGLEYRGRITHNEENDISTNNPWYWCHSPYDISRSLYIDNVLYTVSQSMVKMNSLENLSELNSIKLV